MAVEFTPVRVLVLSIAALWVGAALNRRIGALRRFAIPPAVVGGLLGAIAFALLDAYASVSCRWDMSLRDDLLLVFFAGVGTQAKVRELRAGGRLFVRLGLLTVAFLVLQNLVGVLVALSLGQKAAFGLVAGSVAFAGGHGTAVTWGRIAAEWGYPEVMSHALAFATLGLVAGGVLGGPLATWLVRRRNLAAKETAASPSSTEGEAEFETVPFTIERFLRTLLVFAVCIGAGAELNAALEGTGVVLPGFVTAMLVGAILTNVADAARRPLADPPIRFLSEVSLHLFLAMSLVSLDLTHFADAFLPIGLALVAQAVFALLFAAWLVFRFCGADYTAAAVSAGFVGIGLGATPVGIANVEAVARRFGPAPRALLVLPLIGAGVLDLANAFVIDLYLRVLG